MYTLVVLFFATVGNIVTSQQYRFNSLAACSQVRAELAHVLNADRTMITECVEDKNALSAN